jgi:hypothetical protein
MANFGNGMISAFGFEAAALSLLLFLSVGLSYCFADDAASAIASSFPATELRVFNSDGSAVIGKAQYAISASGGMMTLSGESKYFDGEYDIEVERLRLSAGVQPPALVSYRHSFFNPDRSPQRVSSLDVKAGIGSCQAYVDGEVEDRRSDLIVPDDTYAGATQMLFIVTCLRQNANHITFHSFNCMPEPKIVATDASVNVEREDWSMYPGQLVKLEIRPDLGLLGLFVAPFAPRMYAWFDPNDNWNYVGGSYDRFYKGPRILTVRLIPSRERPGR